jgi:hypothetical protein
MSVGALTEGAELLCWDELLLIPIAPDPRILSRLRAIKQGSNTLMSLLSIHEHPFQIVF